MTRSRAASASDMEWYRYTGPLRDTQGRPPSGCPWNRHWYLGQGELHHPVDYPRVSIDYAIALIELNNGRWIARPEHRGRHTFTVDARQYDTREEALRTAVAAVIRMARWAARRPRAERRFGPHRAMSPEQAERVIRWALGLLGREAPATIRLCAPEKPAGRSEPAAGNGQYLIPLT